MNTEQLTFSLTHQQNGQQLELLPEKAIFWKETRTLLLSDLHLGKAEHFRKAGIAVPAKIHEHDLKILSRIISTKGAQKVIFLGDLFHSQLNQGWWDFVNWMETFPDVEFLLVKGNHDILSTELYQDSRLKIYEQELLVYPFLLTHEPLEDKYKKGALYNISGHIHPAVQLKGAGMQRITLACFYFGLHCALLPAFGKFTGFHKIKPKRDESVFGIAENRVLRL